MRKILTLTMVICLLAMSVVGCGGSDASTKTQYISLGTGSVTGVYYPLGGAIASLITNNIEGYDCVAESTGGAVENCVLISEGNLEIGFVAASTLYDAQNEINEFEGKDGSNVLGCFSFYPEVVQIVSTDPNIKSVPDLKGKRVAVGQSGSGTEVMARKVLELYGLSYDDIYADYLGFGDAADGLKDKVVDAAFCWAGIPTANILDLGTQHDISMISFSNEDIMKLREELPYCVPTEINKEYYSSLVETAQTFSIPAVIACSADLSEEFVYDLMVTVFDNLDVLAQAHDRGADLSLDTALDGLDDIKLHPGAEKFLKEKGVL